MWSVGNMWHWSPRQILRLSHFLFIISLIIIFFFFHMSLCFSHITYSVLISLSLSSSLSLSLSSICLSLIIFLITICLSYHFFFFLKCYSSCRRCSWSCLTSLVEKKFRLFQSPRHHEILQQWWPWEPHHWNSATRPPGRCWPICWPQCCSENYSNHLVKKENH